MPNQDQSVLPRGERLKKLREDHHQSVEKTQVLVREQKQLHQAICQCIREIGKSVPEIAKEIGKPTEQVLWYLMSMKKYGVVAEVGMCGDYPIYKRIQEQAA